MKIGIITIHNSNNYGAVLQAFALQTYLKREGNEVKIINYDNHYLNKGLDIIRHGFNRLEICYTILDILNLRSRIHMIKLFKRFFKEKFDLTPLYSKTQLLKAFPEEYDIYISGSDQIWNPNITNGIVDKVYFCGMAQPGKPVVSYGSSLGGYDFTDNTKNKKIASYLKRYKEISVRESSYIVKLEELTRKSITRVLDPVYLLSAMEWKQVLALRELKRKPYILIYAMSKNRQIIKKVLESNKSKQYDVIVIGVPFFIVKGIRYINDIGPKEFVELFMNASIIVTNSFHGLSFGIIFHKKIQILNNAHNMNRIYDLLEELNLQGILISDKEEININPNIDYQKIDIRLEKMILKSKKYLSKALN